MKLGFIGGGTMAEAIIASLISSKQVAAHEVFVSDVSAERRRLLKRRYGINTYSKNILMPEMAQTIFLAIKPQQLNEVLEEVAEKVTKRHLVISIAAGRKISLIESIVPAARVIRVMPNLPCTVYEGMSVFCRGGKVTEDDRRLASKLLSCLGEVLELPEKQFDAVTALSGSGPAFFAYLLGCMVDAGVKEGLDRKNALLLAEQTMLGTSKLLLQKKYDPSDLIKSVTSAKGTTAAGITVLKKSMTSCIIGQTIKAAAKRSKELSES